MRPLVRTKVCPEAVSIIMVSDGTGHALALSNRDGRFTVNVSDYSQVLMGFDLILKVFEQADTQP